MKSLAPEAGGSVAIFQLFAGNAWLFHASLGCRRKGREDVQLAPLLTHARYAASKLSEQARSTQGRGDVLPGSGGDVSTACSGSVPQCQNDADPMNESEPFLALLVTFSVTQSHSVNLS